jgi:DNA repair photolyase
VTAGLDTRRHERLDACKECGGCPDGTTCFDARGKLRSYGGIRLTADGFDCALPVTIDSHSACSYGCLYCFSPNLVGHRTGMTESSVGQTPLAQVEALFAGRPGKDREAFQQALKYDRRNADGYPCPVQLGGLCDPFDNIERNQGWALEYAKLVAKYRQPTRASTKGTLLMNKEYRAALGLAPELWWVAFSLITIDDDLLARIDRRAPNATQRLKTMARLSKMGVRTSLRLRPMMPGITDATPKHPHAWQELIRRAADAGAYAISYEAAFTPGHPPKDVASRWDYIEDVLSVPMRSVYRRFGPAQACTRPSYSWTEDIMHAVQEEAHACGLVVGVSDPVWKQLGDTGCCCGILPDDPIWGNWQRESATNRLLELQDGTLGEVTIEDVTPAWAHKVLLSKMVNLGVGPTTVYAKRHATWADKMQREWDDLESERGPFVYFQGALVPKRRDANGHLVYRWRGLERQHKRAPYWHVTREAPHGQDREESQGRHEQGQADQVHP